jgi:hypothetical protein
MHFYAGCGGMRRAGEQKVCIFTWVAEVFDGIRIAWEQKVYIFTWVAEVFI